MGADIKMHPECNIIYFYIPVTFNIFGKAFYMRSRYFTTSIPNAPRVDLYTKCPKGTVARFLHTQYICILHANFTDWLLGSHLTVARFLRLEQPLNQAFEVSLGLTSIIVYIRDSFN